MMLWSILALIIQVFSQFSNENLPSFSSVLAHEMGHNLGMNHDDTRCQLEEGSYIMNSGAG